MQRHALLALLVLAALRSSSTKSIRSFAGPYIAYGKIFYMCDAGSPIAWRWYIRTSHFNPARPKELQRITGNVSSSGAEFADTMWFKVVVDARNNNQWKENAFLFRFPSQACSVTSANIPDMANILFKRKCPVPAFLLGGKPRADARETRSKFSKNYMIEFVDKPVAWIFPNVPIMPYGEYRFRLMFGLGNTTLACWCADAVAVPKQ